MNVDGTDEPLFAAFVAVDWGDKKHAWSLQPANSEKRERGEIEHNPEMVAAWAATLSTRFANQPVALAVEQSRGPLVFMLSKYEQLHIYPIQPRAAAQFRAALVPFGAKDDPSDAELLLDLLVHHRSRLRRLKPDSDQTRLIQHLVEGRRKLVNERTRQSNRLTAQLKMYFPQLLDWFDAVDSPLVGALLQRWPTLEALKTARPDTVRSFLTAHNCRNQELIERRVDQIRRAVPAVNDRALLEASQAMTEVLVELIATLRQGIDSFDRQIAQAAEAHPDFAIFDSLPGAGPVLAPRLLAAFGSQRDRYQSAEWVHVRWACPHFLRQTFHEWAGHSIGFCDWARAYYQLQ